MNKIISHIQLLFLAVCLIFTSCSQEPIFQAIDKEIKLEEAVVTGNVYSITETDGTLYAANGKIFKKSNKDIRNWSSFDKPDGLIISLAAGFSDGKYYLYAISSSSDSYTLYGTLIDSINWTKIPINGTIKTLLDNYAPANVNRKAFIVTENGVYELAAFNVYSTAVTTGNASTTGSSTVKAAYIESGAETYFSTSAAFTSNGKDLLYQIGSSSTLDYSYDGSTWFSTSYSISSSDSFAFDSKNNRIISGQPGGCYVASVDANGIPIESFGIPGSNAAATIGQYRIISAFSSNGYIYAGAIASSSSNKNGLWGYYGSDRNNEWNKE